MEDPWNPEYLANLQVAGYQDLCSPYHLSGSFVVPIVEGFWSLTISGHQTTSIKDKVQGSLNEGWNSVGTIKKSVLGVMIGEHSQVSQRVARGLATWACS
jgi:hypothetical protein